MLTNRSKSPRTGRIGSLIGPATVLCMFLPAAAAAGAARVQDCHVGSYRLSDNTAVDIAPSEGETLRWRMFTGETGQLHPQKDGSWTSTYGWTMRPDGITVSFSDCGKGGITFGKQ